MSPQTLMLDTNICSYIMRQRPPETLQRLEDAVQAQHRIVISAITYAEMRFGALSPRAPAHINALVSEFTRRLDAILPWDAAAVDQTAQVRAQLSLLGTPIGHNDAAIAGHALAQGCRLVTHNTREFVRVSGLDLEDWA